MLLLVPSDPLGKTATDEWFASEAEAARLAGHEVAVTDYDAIVAGDIDTAVRRVRHEGEAVYRGWMISSRQYLALSKRLADQGVSMRTSPLAYATGHEFPGWYEAFVNYTPTSAWCEGTDLEAFDDLLALIPTGPVVLKDWVKSMKHNWDEAAFIPDSADSKNARRVAERFVELRGNELVGGIVVRQFEQFLDHEVRTWWVDGRCVLVTAHPDSPESLPIDVPTRFIEASVARLESPFVTVDLACRNDGEWRVVEVGDGQVSDRPSSSHPTQFLAAILG